MAKVRALVAQELEEAPADEAPLSLSSFQMVALVEELEDAFGVQLLAADVVPENFASISRIAALMARRAT